MNWKSAPYYVQPDEVRVMTPWGSRPTAESMMQVLTMQHLGRPNGFVWGMQPAPAQLVQQFIDYARSLTDFTWAPYTTIGFDASARAVYYANQVMETLKQIPATMADSGADPNDSIYDVWTRAK